jgi:hypothetical protein
LEFGVDRREYRAGRGRARFSKVSSTLVIVMDFSRTVTCLREFNSFLG